MHESDIENSGAASPFLEADGVACPSPESNGAVCLPSENVVAASTSRIRVESDQDVEQRDLERVREAKQQADSSKQRGWGLHAAFGRHGSHPEGASIPGGLPSGKKAQTSGIPLHGGKQGSGQGFLAGVLSTRLPRVFFVAAAALVVVAAVAFGAHALLTAPASPVDEPAAQEAETSSADNADVEGPSDEAANPHASQDVDQAEPVDFVQHVGELYQMEELQGGCEVASLTIVLDSMGFDVDSHTIADEYLSYEEGDMVNGFAGDPYYYGSAFPPVIADAADAFLEANESPYRALDLTGASFEELAAWVEKGYPVLVWSTMYLGEPDMTGIMVESYEWYNNEHCVVLYGLEGETALVSDPLEGLVERDAQEFARIFEDCGSMAIVIR